VVGHI